MILAEGIQEAFDQPPIGSSINIKRLRDTQVPEFKDSYDNINSYFRDFGLLLKASKNPGDKLYRTAVKKFDFSEVRGINLGFSKGTRGAGFGPKLSSQIVKDASEIIKSGSEQPEIFCTNKYKQGDR